MRGKEGFPLGTYSARVTGLDQLQQECLGETLNR